MTWSDEFAVLTGSVPGPEHVRCHRNNQDACGIQPGPDAVVVVVTDLTRKPPIQEELMQRALSVCQLQLGGCGYKPPTQLLSAVPNGGIEQAIQHTLKEQYGPFAYDEAVARDTLHVQQEFAILKCVSNLREGTK